MGDDRNKQRASRPVAQAAPPVQRPDFQVSGSADTSLNCRTALLFPDSAPLTDDAVYLPTRRAKPPIGRKRSDKTESTTLDLQAVWTHVSRPPGPEGAAVLVFLHGFYTYVTITPDGACALPSWADNGFDQETTKTVALFEKAKSEKAAALNRKLKDKDVAELRAQLKPALAQLACFSAGYGLVDVAGSYKGSLVTIAPENVNPYATAKFPTETERAGGKKTQYSGTIPAKGLKSNKAGRLAEKDGLGNLVDECLQRLTIVTPAAGRPKCPAPPLKSIPKINRLFLAGHSGAHVGLYDCAQSALAKSMPADLILLDCFYINGRATAAIEEFAKNAPGGLGNGPGQSRIILVANPRGYSDKTTYNAVLSMLRTKFKDKVAEVQFQEGKTYAESALNAIEPARKAMRQFPVVIVSGALSHFTIPPDFVPLVLETAPTP